MASHKRPKRFRARGLATAASAAAASVTALAPAGHAEPAPSADQVSAQVDKLYQQAEQSTQRYDAAKEQTEALQLEVSQLQDELARKADAVESTRTRLNALAAEQYRSGTLSAAMQLALADDPQQFLERSGMLNQASAIEQTALRQYGQQRAALDTKAAEARSKLADLAEREQQLATDQADIQRKLAEAQSLLARLSDTDRAALARASRDTARPLLDAVPAEGRAAQAVAFAVRQLGKPYVWGATGPDSYDCSGLVQAAWRSAGVSLPRTTYDQITAAPRISRSELRPGDLVFFFSGVSHVGIYTGNGRMIHAPHPGAPIRYASVDAMPFAGAVRPA